MILQNFKDRRNRDKEEKYSADRVNFTKLNFLHVCKYHNECSLLKLIKINIEKKHEVLRQCSSSCINPCIQEELKGTSRWPSW
jgi:hypothetical protein